MLWLPTFPEEALAGAASLVPLKADCRTESAGGRSPLE